MELLSWRDKLRVYAARFLMFTGKLRHDEFTIEELDELIAPYFPRDFTLKLPVGDGLLNLIKAKILLNEQQNRVQIQCLAALKIDALATPLYRAHLAMRASATPRYDKQSATLHFDAVSLDEVRLINDDYALVNSSRSLLERLLPAGISGLIAAPVKTAFAFLGTTTGGVSTQLRQYLSLYLNGNKQRILDYHLDDIRVAAMKELDAYGLHYQMDNAQWRQYLFSQYGEYVAVEDNTLRFFLKT